MEYDPTIQPLKALQINSKQAASAEYIQQMLVTCLK